MATFADKLAYFDKRMSQMNMEIAELKAEVSSIKVRLHFKCTRYAQPDIFT